MNKRWSKSSRTIICCNTDHPDAIKCRQHVTKAGLLNRRALKPERTMQLLLTRYTLVLILLASCKIEALVPSRSSLPAQNVPSSCPTGRSQLHRAMYSNVSPRGMPYLNLHATNACNIANDDIWNGSECSNVDTARGFRKRLSKGVVNFINDKFKDKKKNTSKISGESNNSLFAKRSARGKINDTSTVPTILFLLLKRISLGASLAWASTSTSTSTLTKPIMGRSYTQSLLSRLPSISPSASWITMRNLRTFLLAVMSILAITTLKESIAAIRRQKMDATSEWGRYADKPSARGLALMIVLLRLTPYIIGPIVIEKLATKTKDENGKQQPITSPRDRPNYKSTRPYKLRNRGGQIFANGLLRLGPLYIKIGQILSCRENLFPTEWIAAMEKLQDRVPAKSGEEAWNLAYEACPGGSSTFHQIFSDFNDVPLAAASLGQVHKARLRSTGEAVAIKIQRPRLRDIYEKDLALMNRIAKYVDTFGGKAGQVGGVQQSWQQIFKDAEDILYREIDYRAEAENAIRFANDFGLGMGGKSILSTAKGVDGKSLPSASEWLRVPFTYGDLSSEKFLVMEYVPSIKVSNNAKLDMAGVTIEDREYLAEALAHSYLRQFCSHKFFSTDPHPGNLGVEVFDDGSPPRLVFYDFGQACSLSNDQSGGILEVIESIIDLDAKKSVSAFSRMGVLKDDADLDKVLAKVQSNYDTGKLKVKKRKKRQSARYRRDVQQSSKEVSTTVDLELATSTLDNTTSAPLEKPSNATTISPEKEDPEVMEYFTLQSEYAFVARALSQMDGVGKGLDKEFDFISAAAPYLVEVKGAGRYLIDEAKKKLKFVYDPYDGILAKEVALFKSFGFEPNQYSKRKK